MLNSPNKTNEFKNVSQSCPVEFQFTCLHVHERNVYFAY